MECFSAETATRDSCQILPVETATDISLVVLKVKSKVISVTRRGGP
jgi:hypothetical protein